MVDKKPPRHAYDAKVHKLIDEHVGKLKEMFASQAKAKDKAEKVKTIKSWLGFVDNIVEKNSVPSGSELEKQIWCVLALTNFLIS